MRNKKIYLFVAIAAIAVMVVSGIGITGLVLADTNNTADTNRPNPGTMGKVSSISGTNITLTGKQGPDKDAADVTYTIDASNATFKKFAEGSDGKPSETAISISDIQVGDMIMVQGEVSGTSVVAKEIMVGNPGKGPNGPDGQHNPGTMGKVSSISGTNITLTGKQGPDKDAADVTYTIDASNATFKKFAEGSDGKPSETAISISDIQVGDMIMVQGEVSGTSVVAKEIMVGQPVGKGGPDKLNKSE